MRDYSLHRCQNLWTRPVTPVALSGFQRWGQNNDPLEALTGCSVFIAPSSGRLRSRIVVLTFRVARDHQPMNLIRVMGGAGVGAGTGSHHPGLWIPQIAEVQRILHKTTSTKPGHVLHT